MERAAAVKRQRPDSPAADTHNSSRRHVGDGTPRRSGSSSGSPAAAAREEEEEEDFIAVPQTPSTPVDLRQLDSTLMDFGKHCDKTYLWVLQHDQGYCNWALEREAPSSKLRSFVEYLEQKRAAGIQCGTEVYTTPGGLGLLDWVDDYVGSNKARGLSGYCWEWLESGGCIGCSFKHSYPPIWTSAQRQAHRRRAEADMMAMAFSYEEGEEEGEDEDENEDCSEYEEGGESEGGGPEFGFEGDEEGEEDEEDEEAEEEEGW